MRILLCLLALSTLPRLIGQETLNLNMTYDGLERQYILYVPESYEEGNPLLLNFHGYTSNALAQLAYGDFTAIADTAGFLIAHPQGTEDSNGNTHWNVGWGFSTVDDIGFTSALIDTLAENYDIDLSRVYSTGMSNGGFMSYTLACELSERIAAIASVTGTMNIGSFESCDPQHPMPVMEIHGTADGTVPYLGADWIEGSEDVVSWWAEYNGTSAAPVVTDVPDIDTDDDCTAEHWVYAGGTDGAEVELYKIIDGGHTWPGAFFNLSVTNQDIDASTEIWRFFSRYDIDGLIEPSDILEHTDGVIGLQLSIDPSHTQLYMDWEGDDTDYRIFDIRGAVMTSGKLNKGINRMAIHNWTTGQYILQIGGSSQRFTVTH